MVDLDRFKQVNDTLGHHAGDLVLQQVGSIFTSRVRLTDTVARTGGDEFSIILEDAGSALYANQVAGFLLQLLNEPLKVEEKTVWVGASIGVAVFPDDATDDGSSLYRCRPADVQRQESFQKTQTSCL